MNKTKIRGFKIFLFIIIFCVITVFFLYGNLFFQNKSSPNSSPLTITEFNEIFENDNFKVSFTEIHAYKNNLNPEKGDFKICANYTVENTFNRSWSIGFDNLNVYADNIAVDSSSSYATIAPGKKANLKCITYAFEDTKQIEFYLNDPRTFEHIVTFQFDLPPIEEIEFLQS